MNTLSHRRHIPLKQYIKQIRSVILQTETKRQQEESLDCLQVRLMKYDTLYKWFVLQYVLRSSTYFFEDMNTR